MYGLFSNDGVALARLRAGNVAPPARCDAMRCPRELYNRKSQADWLHDRIIACSARCLLILCNRERSVNSAVCVLYSLVHQKLFASFFHFDRTLYTQRQHYYTATKEEISRSIASVYINAVRTLAHQI